MSRHFVCNDPLFSSYAISTEVLAEYQVEENHVTQDQTDLNNREFRYAL